MLIQSKRAFMIAATPGAVGISRWLVPDIINPPHARKGTDNQWAWNRLISPRSQCWVSKFAKELLFGDVRHDGYSDGWPRAETGGTS